MCALSFQLLRRRCAARECGPGVLKGLAERVGLESNLLYLPQTGTITMDADAGTLPTIAIRTTTPSPTLFLYRWQR